MKKINIYIDGKYECSTNSSKTCKEALNNYIRLYSGHKNQNNIISIAGHLEGKKVTASYK